jgi:hypothetical protein
MLHAIVRPDRDPEPVCRFESEKQPASENDEVLFTSNLTATEEHGRTGLGVSRKWPGLKGAVTRA